MTRICSEAELDRMADASKRIVVAMNDVPEYDLLCGMMSAHIQRMVCNRAFSSDGEPLQLLEEFQAACLAKVKWWTEMRDGKSDA